MGFGAIIASGKNNTFLRDDLLDCLTEVRVEQFLDEPTRFALRFQEDIHDGEPFIMKSPELKCEQMITIAVQVDDVIRCLVRGPITNTKSSVKLGGPGSWHEVHGQDRRVELNRKRIPRAGKGKASVVAQGERAKAGATQQAVARAQIHPPSLGTSAETECAVPC